MGLRYSSPGGNSIPGLSSGGRGSNPVTSFPGGGGVV